MSKILRAVYTYDDADQGANVHFSRWIEDGGQAVIENELITSPPGDPGANMPIPVILGWQESELGAVDLVANLASILSDLGDIKDKCDDILENLPE